jgi:hypothetical protein
LTLNQYIERRNGVPLGASGALRNMLHRSLGAGSFAAFWQYWNPIFGYYLAKYVDSPLRRILPRSIALILTFVICGALHDLAAMAVRGSVAFFCTTMFFFFGAGVLIGRWTGLNFSSLPWAARAGINFAYLFSCFALALVARHALAIP